MTQNFLTFYISTLFTRASFISHQHSCGKSEQICVRERKIGKKWERKGREGVHIPEEYVSEQTENYYLNLEKKNALEYNSRHLQSSVEGPTEEALHVKTKEHGHKKYCWAGGRVILRQEK